MSDLDDALALYSAWRGVFEKHIEAALQPGAKPYAETVGKVISNAKITADEALRVMQESFDRFVPPHLR
jgi:hypothetical protein